MHNSKVAQGYLPSAAILWETPARWNLLSLWLLGFMYICVAPLCTLHMVCFLYLFFFSSLSLSMSPLSFSLWLFICPVIWCRRGLHSIRCYACGLYIDLGLALVKLLEHVMAWAFHQWWCDDFGIRAMLAGFVPFVKLKLSCSGSSKALQLGQLIWSLWGKQIVAASGSQAIAASQCLQLILAPNVKVT